MVYKHESQCICVERAFARKSQAQVQFYLKCKFHVPKNNAKKRNNSEKTEKRNERREK